MPAKLIIHERRHECKASGLALVYNIQACAMENIEELARRDERDENCNEKAWYNFHDESACIDYYYVRICIVLSYNIPAVAIILPPRVVSGESGKQCNFVEKDTYTQSGFISWLGKLSRP